MLLLKTSFKREKIIFHKKIGDKKIFINKFYFRPNIFFLIAWNKIFKNDANLMNHRSFLQEKDSIQLDCFQFLKIYQLLLNIAICL